jgi:hypothetical protein
VTRTFLEMANEALHVRWRLILDMQHPDKAYFECTRAELKLMGKRPWVDDIQPIHNNRLYGLRLKLVEG